jgi:hypothetical protein
MFVATGVIGGRVLAPNRSLDFANGMKLSMSAADFGAVDSNLLSFSAWARYQGVPSGGGGAYYSPLIEKSNSFRIMRMNSYLLRVEYYYLGGVRYFYTTNYLADDIWYRLRVHIDAANADSTQRIKVWLDGVPESPSLYSAPAGGITDSVDDIQIGGVGSAGDNYTVGQIYQLGVYNGDLVDEIEVYSGGIKDIRQISSLFSTIHTDSPNITDDYIKSAAWTNTGGVTLSTAIPT